MFGVFAVAAGSSGALSVVWRGGRRVCMQEEKQPSGRYKIQKALWGSFFTSRVLTSCSPYLYFLCSVICTGLTHPVTASSAQMVLRDPLMPCTIGVNYGSGSCPCPRCVFTSDLLTVAFMLPLQQPNTRISTLVCQEVGHWPLGSTAGVVRVSTVPGLPLNAGTTDPRVVQSRGGTLPLKGCSGLNHAGF